MVECSFTTQMILGSSPVAVTWTSDFAPVPCKEFLDIQTNIELEFIRKRLRHMKRSYSQMTVQISTHNTAQSFGQWGQMVEYLLTSWLILCSIPLLVTKTSDFTCASSKEFDDIQATTECGFTLKCVRDMRSTYSQMNRQYKYWELSSVIWLHWRNGWVFVYELSDYRLVSSSSQLNFRFRAWFKQGVPQHSGNYKGRTHSETRRWHDNNIQSNAPYR